LQPDLRLLELVDLWLILLAVAGRLLLLLLDYWLGLGNTRLRDWQRQIRLASWVAGCTLLSVNFVLQLDFDPLNLNEKVLGLDQSILAVLCHHYEGR